jgi:hypothetical protein
VAQQQAQVKALNQQMTDWEREWKAQPRWQERLGHAVRAVNEFADPQTQAFVRSHPVFQMPGVLEMLSKAGQMLADDRGRADGKGHGDTRTAAQKLYPSMPNP